MRITDTVLFQMLTIGEQVADGSKNTQKQQEIIDSLEAKINDMLTETTKNSVDMASMAVNNTGNLTILRVELQKLKQLYDQDTKSRQTLNKKVDEVIQANERVIFFII